MVANERGPGTAAIFFSHQFHMVVVYRLERRGGGRRGTPDILVGICGMLCGFKPNYMIFPNR